MLVSANSGAVSILASKQSLTLPAPSGTRIGDNKMRVQTRRRVWDWSYGWIGLGGTAPAGHDMRNGRCDDHQKSRSRVDG
jgi:hypothetical protein